MRCECRNGGASETRGGGERLAGGIRDEEGGGVWRFEQGWDGEGGYGYGCDGIAPYFLTLAIGSEF